MKTLVKQKGSPPTLWPLVQLFLKPIIRPRLVAFPSNIFQYSFVNINLSQNSTDLGDCTVHSSVNTAPEHCTVHHFVCTVQLVYCIQNSAWKINTVHLLDMVQHITEILYSIVLQQGTIRLLILYTVQHLVPYYTVCTWIIIMMIKHFSTTKMYCAATVGKVILQDSNNGLLIGT